MSLPEQSQVVNPQTPERRPITVEELRLLADAVIAEFPELRRRLPGEVLAGWRRLAERHRIYIEHRRPVKGAP